jgi:hypothetical protein
MIPTRVFYAIEIGINSGYTFLVSYLLIGTLSIGAFASYTLLFTVVLGSRILYQYFILNQFNLLRVTECDETSSVNFRFLVYTSTLASLFALISVLMSMYMPTKLVFSICFLIITELYFHLLRAISLRSQSRLLLIFQSTVRLGFSCVLISLYLEPHSSLDTIFFILGIPNILVIFILLFCIRFKKTNISSNTVTSDFWDQGKYQLPAGLISWQKNSVPYFLISWVLGEEKLVIFRALQLFFAPIAMFFSIFESYFPQLLARQKDKESVHEKVKVELKLITITAPLVILVYIAVAGILRERLNFGLLDQLTLVEFFFYAIFIFLIPFNALLQISLRYFDLSKYILGVGIIEAALMPFLMLVSLNYLGLLGVPVYLSVITFILVVCHYYQLKGKR